MIDINGIEIKVGMRVKTQQPSGGILPPSPPETGIVEECLNAFGKQTLRIRYRRHYSFDQFILLDGKINEVVSD